LTQKCFKSKITFPAVAAKLNYVSTQPHMTFFGSCGVCGKYC